VRFRRLYEFIRDATRASPGHPLLAGSWVLAESYWRALAAGTGPRIVFDDCGDVVWPVEEAVHLALARDFDAAYAELRAVVARLLDVDGVEVDVAELESVFAYQEAQTPRPGGPARRHVEIGWDFPAWFEALRVGRDSDLARRALTLEVVDHHQVGGDLGRFAREVVWYGRAATTIPYRLVPRGGERVHATAG
jgi:hypothetical protein